MLERSELIDLERSLRDSLVLSVYIDGTVRDPVERTVWRTRLGHELEQVQGQIADRSERGAFDRAAGLLREELAPVTGAIGAPGWMGIVTPDEVRYRSTLPASPPPYVHWGRGMSVAPAVRTLKEMRPAILAVVDSRSTRLFRYRGGTLEPLEKLRAHAVIDPVSHMGAPPRPGFHSGTRGRTGTDAAERELREGRARMMRELASRMVHLAGTEGWLLLGGTPAAAHAASAALPESVASRTMLVSELQIGSTGSDIARYAAHGASTLRQRQDLTAVRTLFEHARGGGRAEIRIDPVRRALEDSAVQRLFLTVRRIDDQPERAEALVRAAFDVDADVEVVAGEGAVRLDAEAEGVGALLRFIPANQAQTAARQE